jgi:hypothetical protein
MFKQFSPAIIVALVFIAASSNGMTNAQTMTSQHGATTEDIRRIVMLNVGSQDKAVEVSRTGNVLLISRVNSNLNGAPHQLVNNESVSIASVVSKAIIGNPEYENIHTIRVQYLNRTGSPPKDKILDQVEFRKGQNDAFDLHLS